MREKTGRWVCLLKVFCNQEGVRDGNTGRCVVNDRYKVDRAPVRPVCRWRELKFLVDAVYFNKVNPFCLVWDAFEIEAVSVLSSIVNERTT